MTSMTGGLRLWPGKGLGEGLTTSMTTSAPATGSALSRLRT